MAMSIQAAIPNVSLLEGEEAAQFESINLFKSPAQRLRHHTDLKHIWKPIYPTLIKNRRLRQRKKIQSANQ